MQEITTVNHNPQRFQKWVNKIWEHHVQQGTQETLRHDTPPTDYLKRMNLSLSGCDSPVSEAELDQWVDTLQAESVATSHPLFMNQLYGHVHDIGLLGDMLTTHVNTSMATYEIAPFLTLVEKEVIAQMAREIGFTTWDGLMTPGGSLSNMQAMLMAKDQRFPEARSKGAKTLPEVCIFVSDQAHYSFVKFSQLLGLGQHSVVKVASEHKGAMKPEALKTAIQEALDAGKTPLMIAATAGTTVSGAYDNLEALADLAAAHKMWFHVDGSYGGSLLLTHKADLLKGIDRADSVAWNPHKMLGVPFHCPALITRHKGALEASLSTDASYLFHDDETDFNLGQKSLHCGRRPEAFKFWLSWQAYGRQGLSQRVEGMLQGAQHLADAVKAHPQCELLCEPEAPVVCFQYTPPGVDLSAEALNDFQQRLRDHLFAQGKMLFNYAHISGLTVLRCVVAHPEFTPEHAQYLLSSIEQGAQELLAR